jgi:hypothetical protein
LIASISSLPVNEYIKAMTLILDLELKFSDNPSLQRICKLVTPLIKSYDDKFALFNDHKLQRALLNERIPISELCKFWIYVLENSARFEQFFYTNPIINKLLRNKDKLTDEQWQKLKALYLKDLTQEKHANTGSHDPLTINVVRIIIDDLEEEDPEKLFEIVNSKKNRIEDDVNATINYQNISIIEAKFLLIILQKYLQIDCISHKQEAKELLKKLDVMVNGIMILGESVTLKNIKKLANKFSTYPSFIFLAVSKYLSDITAKRLSVDQAKILKTLLEYLIEDSSIRWLSAQLTNLDNLLFKLNQNYFEEE